MANSKAFLYQLLNSNVSVQDSIHGGVKIVVEVDDFVIIPAITPFQDVVTTVLNLMGYPKDVIQQAEGKLGSKYKLFGSKLHRLEMLSELEYLIMYFNISLCVCLTGSILLKNWKPLKLEQICDSPHKTVGDILNDLTNHATLRVLVTR